MKTIKLFSGLSLLVGIAALVVACNQNSKEEVLPSPSDEPVRFSAVSNSDPKVRSSFSNELNDNNIERIDWKSGDKVTIWSDNADDHTDAKSNIADYTVSANGTAANEKSKAGVSPAGSNLLKWYGAGAFDKYKFWAVYPTSNVTIAKDGNKAATGTSASFSANIPASQELTEHEYSEEVTKLEPSMDYAFMAGYLETPKSPDPITLPFWPSFTAFEINVKSADMEFELVDFTIASTDDSPVAGDFVATWNGEGNVGGWTYAAGQQVSSSITTQFASGTTISAEKDITFTVFALPITMTNLKLTFSIKQGESVLKKSINLSKGETALSFGGCQKHRINALAIPTGWRFSVITLNLVAMEWEQVTLPESGTFDGYAQASQFEISGDATEGSTRQQWTVHTGNEFIITYKVFLPEGGTWKIEPKGDVGSFSITGATSGTVEEGGTRVKLNITPTAAGKTLYFNTTVTKDGVTYNLDSETQLYDMRGYHKFTSE